MLKKTRTVTVTADMSVMMRHTFEVPADYTDEQIENLCEALDPAEFEEVENGGDWAQTWEATPTPPKTVTVRGSCGEIITDESGKILDRSQADEEYSDILAFDFSHTSLPYDIFEFGDVDICYIGIHRKSGYEPPADFEREENGEWKVYKPRKIDG